MYADVQIPVRHKNKFRLRGQYVLRLLIDTIKPWTQNMHESAFQTTSVDPTLLEHVKAYVLNPTFPCVGARSAVNTGRAQFGSFGSLGSDEPAGLQAMCDALTGFSQAYPTPGEAPVTGPAASSKKCSDQSARVM